MRYEKRTPENEAWRQMRSRCNNPNHKKYHRPEYSIERLDNDGDYEPGNVIWATQHQQQSNKSNNHWLTIGGRRMIVAQWARELGIAAGTVLKRYSTPSS